MCNLKIKKTFISEITVYITIDKMQFAICTDRWDLSDNIISFSYKGTFIGFVVEPTIEDIELLKSHTHQCKTCNQYHVSLTRKDTCKSCAFISFNPLSPVTEA